MAINIDTIIRNLSQPIADTKIGRKRVYLYALTSENMSSISELSDEEKPLENYKSLIRIISSLKKPDKSNKRTAPTEEFISLLSLTDLNMLAETYLKTFYAKSINEKLKKPLQMNVSEESIEYLYRMLKIHIEEFNERSKDLIKRTLDPFQNVREASLNLTKKIETYNFSPPPFVEQARTAQQQRMEELEMARVTAEMSKDSANLLSKLSIDVTEFLEQWRTETKNNNNSTNIQLWIAVGSLIVSALLSGFALYYSYLSYTQDAKNNKESNVTQQDILNNLSKANQNSNDLLKQNSNLQDRISVLIEGQKNQHQIQDLPKN